MNVLKFTEEMRKVQIVKGRTLLAYIPVMLRRTKEMLKTGQLNRGRQFNRTDSLQTIPKCIGYVLECLSDSSIEGFQVFSKVGQRFRLHGMLASYIADIPKAEDILSVKRVNITKCLSFEVIPPKIALFSHLVAVNFPNLSSI